MLSRKRNRQNKSMKRPFYDGHRRVWKVEFADRDPEEGDLLYVAGEYARTGLYFPYRTKDMKDWQEHAHEFEGVIEALLEEPENFSMDYQQSAKHQTASVLMMNSVESAVSSR